MKTSNNILALTSLALAAMAGSASATVTTNNDCNSPPRTHDWCTPISSHPRPITRDCRDDDRPSRPRHIITDCLPQVIDHHNDNNSCDWSWLRNTHNDRNDCDDRNDHHTGPRTPPRVDCTPFTPRPPHNNNCDTPITHHRDCDDDRPQTPRTPCDPTPCPPRPDCHDRPPTGCNPPPPCVPTPTSAGLLGLSSLALFRRRREA